MLVLGILGFFFFARGCLVGLVQSRWSEIHVLGLQMAQLLNFMF